MTRKLTILQVVPRIDSGGAERATIEIARALVAAHHTAVVVSEGGRMEKDLRDIGAPMVKLPVASKNPFAMGLNAFRLAQIIRNQEVDIIHARSRAAAWSCLFAARLTAIPFVTTYHGHYQAQSSWKRAYNGVMTRGDRVIANSGFTARHIAAVYPDASQRIETIPRGVDLVEFDPERVTSERINALRAAWGIPVNQRIILAPGRLTDWKGQTVVVEAMAELAGKGQANDLACVFVGDTQSKEFLTLLLTRIKEAGLGDRVRVPGHCGDMAAAYCASAAVIQASTLPEAFGRVAVEAQACGSIIVASDVGALAETIVEGEARTGFRVMAGNARQLAQTLSGVLSLSPAQRTQIGRRARDYVRTHYALQKMCTATLAVYERLASNSAERA